MKYISSSQFKSGSKGAIAKSVNATVVASDSDRTLTFVISTSEPDRDSDVVNQSGIDLTNYLKNPVVLAFHNSDTWPIGKCIALSLNDEGNMTAVVEFIPESVPVAGPLAECAYQLAKTGFMSAVSIGFLPIEYVYPPDRPTGLNFEVTELLEFSLVPIPCNADALMVQQDDSVDVVPETAKTAKILNNSDAIFCRLRLAQAIAL